MFKHIISETLKKHWVHHGKPLTCHVFHIITVASKLSLMCFLILILWKGIWCAVLENKSQSNLRLLLKSVYGNFLSDPGNKHKGNDHTPSIIEIIEMYIKREYWQYVIHNLRTMFMHCFIRDIRRQKHGLLVFISFFASLWPSFSVEV